MTPNTVFLDANDEIGCFCCCSCLKINKKKFFVLLLSIENVRVCVCLYLCVVKSYEINVCKNLHRQSIVVVVFHSVQREWRCFFFFIHIIKSLDLFVCLLSLSLDSIPLCNICYCSYSWLIQTTMGINEWPQSKILPVCVCRVERARHRTPGLCVHFLFVRFGLQINVLYKSHTI